VQSETLLGYAERARPHQFNVVSTVLHSNGLHGGIALGELRAPGGESAASKLFPSPCAERGSPVATCPRPSWSTGHDSIYITGNDRIHLDTVQLVGQDLKLEFEGNRVLVSDTPGVLASIQIVELSSGTSSESDQKFA